MSRLRRAGRYLADYAATLAVYAYGAAEAALRWARRRPR